MVAYPSYLTSEKPSKKYDCTVRPIKERRAEKLSDKTDNGKNGNSSEYLYFDIASMPRSSFTKSLTLIIKEKGNTARSKNEDEPVTIIQ